MASLSQKTKLLKLLKGLNKDDFLEAEIINGIINELEALKASIPEQQNLSPYFESVKLLENEYSNISSSVTGLSKSLTQAATEFQNFGKVTDERLAKIGSETSKIVKDLKNELEKINFQILELKGRGGGSMPFQIKVNGTVATTRYADINIVGSVTSANDDTKKVTTLTFSGSSGGLALLTPTGTVDGTNQVFSFSKAPSLIFVDQGRFMQATSSDGTVNWTGTTSVTLSIAPTSDIFGLG